MLKDNLKKKLDECQRVRDEVDSQIWESFVKRMKISEQIDELELRAHVPEIEVKVRKNKQTLSRSYCCR